MMSRDAHGDADPARSLDLRAADLNRVAVTDIVFDGRGKPGRRHVEIDRACAERHHRPPKQPAKITSSEAKTMASRQNQRPPASERRNAPKRSVHE